MRLGLLFSPPGLAGGIHLSVPLARTKAGLTAKMTALFLAFMMLSGAVTLLMPPPKGYVSAFEENQMPDDGDLTIYGAPGGKDGGDGFGTSLALGDIDDDGYDDLIAGAPYADGDVDLWRECGEVYVFWGGPQGWTGDEVNASADANITIIVSDDNGGPGGESGRAVASGDVNGDGNDDIIVGEPAYSDLGRVYIIFGGARGSLEGSTLNMSAGDWDVKVTGSAQGERLGGSISVGNVDGDGFADVLIGSSNYTYGSGPPNGGAGRVHILFGGAGLTGAIDPDTLPTIVNSLGTGADDAFGDSIAQGDIDNDGMDDIAIGAPGARDLGDDRKHGGQVHVFWGNSQGFWTGGDWSLDTTPANVTVNGTAGSLLGTALATGDLDNDGGADLIMGAPGGAGVVHVIYGAGQGSMPEYLDLKTDDPDIILHGHANGDMAGYAVASADVNDDGYDDMLVGAPGAEGLNGTVPDGGLVYQVFGKTRGSMGDQKALCAHVIYGGADAEDGAGSAVAAGDMDGDGIADVAMGAPFGDGETNSGTDTGEVYVVYGASRSTFIASDIRSEGASGQMYSWGGIFILRFNVTNANTGSGINVGSPYIIIDPDGKAIKYSWQGALDYLEENDPDDVMGLIAGDSDLYRTTQETYMMDWGLKFHWNFNETEPQDVLVSCSVSGVGTVQKTFRDLLWVENDLILEGTPEAVAEHQGDIAEGDFVRGEENVTFTGLKLHYDGSDGLVPQTLTLPTVYAKDNEGDVFTGSVELFTGNVTITVTSDAVSDPDELLSFGIKDRPHKSVKDRTTATFALKVDAEPPSKPYNVTCWADEPFDTRPWADRADEDFELFVTWDNATENASGSGLALHAMAPGDPAPSVPNSSGDRALANDTGELTVYVRAADNVGNWGEARKAVMLIDMKTVRFDDMWPSEGLWLNKSKVNATAAIADRESVEDEGAGVDPNSVYYRVSGNGDDPAEYGNWTPAGTEGGPAPELEAWAVLKGVAEGDSTFIQWKAADTSGSGAVKSDPVNVLVDLTGPSFTSPSPDPGRWATDGELSVAVNMSDVLSGLDVASIGMELSQDSGATWTPWTMDPLSESDGAKSLTAGSRLTLPEGVGAMVRWTAQDMAGNTAVSDAYPVRVDTGPVEISCLAPAPGKVLADPVVTVGVLISDAVSGVDVTTIEYRYMVTDDAAGNGTWTNWTKPIESLISSGSVAFDVNLTLLRGQGNAVQFRAGDIAGTGLVSTKPYGIHVNVLPLPLISSPSDGDAFNETASIKFDSGGSRDPGGTILLWSWESSLDGHLGDGAAFSSSLSPGNHTITLTVTDDIGASASATVGITVIEENRTQDGGDGNDTTDGGGGSGDSGDKGELSDASTLVVIGIVTLFLALVLYFFVIRRRKGDEHERGLKEKKKKLDAKARSENLLFFHRSRFRKRGGRRKGKDDDDDDDWLDEVEDDDGGDAEVEDDDGEDAEVEEEDDEGDDEEDGEDEGEDDDEEDDEEDGRGEYDPDEEEWD